MLRSPAKSLTSNVTSSSDAEIPTSHFRAGHRRDGHPVRFDIRPVALFPDHSFPDPYRHGPHREVSVMTTAIIGTGGIGSVIARLWLRVARPCVSRAPTMSRHEGWLQRSVELRSSPSITVTRCRGPMRSSSRGGLPC